MAKANFGAFFTVIPLCQNGHDKISITLVNEWIDLLTFAIWVVE